MPRSPPPNHTPTITSTQRLQIPIRSRPSSHSSSPLPPNPYSEYEAMTTRHPPRTTTASGVRRNLFHHRRPTTSSTSTSATTLQVASEDANQEMVARDEHGNYRLEQPAMTPLPRNDLQEEREAENRLIETYRKHQQHIEPHELKATLQASLQAKVASLEDDRWMFEAEDAVAT
ncbi:uncharacterized protein BDZ99DRAFT_462424 [Mytilinidion resinicola]|uniref:Uncharacterized protein n=1 Tax=Mytilinidion resinicola TaxID=574789 RepID=A0A6A6YQW6_9PEZI|nr:uncharacterized protein BDZ99DRAFT_462424 [Mytilinidion resinicola]KAF2811151.1 hypothetical protein BDZ99DRAFT_462424 [Mytilinidion resinicola]